MKARGEGREERGGIYRSAKGKELIMAAEGT